MKNLIIGIKERPKSIWKWVMLSVQHVFGMFGATILVPLLTGLDIGVALVASGIGTLIYIACTRGKVPIYLGSSFAYIAAIASAGALGGYGSAFIGLMVVGIIYMIIATIIAFVGNEWLKKLLPPVVVGPMIMIIGLGLAPVAISSAGLDGSQGWQVPLVAVISFATVVFVAIKGNSFFKIIPFLIAILVGYIASILFGIVNIAEVFEGVKFFQIPNFTFIGTYSWDFSAVLIFAPIAFVTIAEHIGDHTVLGEICEEDFITNPGLNKTLLGDGLATFVSASIGGPANTSYGENTGIVAMTKVGSVWVIGLAATIAIMLGFLGWIQAFIMSIPWAVIGGMTIVLYGLIAGNGVKVLIRSKTDLSQTRNIVVVATMLVIGLGGAAISFGIFSFYGMSLAAIVGIVLNQLLPQEKEKE